MENQPQHQLNPATDNGKTVALVCYLTLIGFIVALVMHSSNKTSLGAFHLRQALMFVIVGIVGSFIFWIPFIGWGIAIFFFVLWIFGFIAAINGEEKPMPVLGQKAQEWFATTFT